MRQEPIYSSHIRISHQCYYYLQMLPFSQSIILKEDHLSYIDYRTVYASSAMSEQRRLRVIVITTEGSDRQRCIQDLFAHPSMAATFEPPTFSPSVPSRELRNRFQFFKLTNDAGLIPPLEWDAIRSAHEAKTHDDHPETFFDCLDNVPITEGRRGSKSDVKLHYSKELWFKAKTLNRGRSVLGCTLAHLIALKRFTTEDFDVVLEDNVRAPVESCANLVKQASEASKVLSAEKGVDCHFRFIGWLGSLTNLEYLLHTHSRKRSFPCSRTDSDKSTGAEQNVGVFPFPLLSHLASDLDDLDAPDMTATEEGNDEEKEVSDDKSSGTRHTRPGGNFIWGSYAYWISETAYRRLLETLRNDVGAMLWKGKRARHYNVKPIDKMLPRQIMSLCGAESVQISNHPAFFRAPMLTSKIHVQWDPEFCKSTEYQLQNTGLDWSHLWLSAAEQEAVERRRATGSWLPNSAEVKDQ